MASINHAGLRVKHTERRLGCWLLARWPFWRWNSFHSLLSSLSNVPERGSSGERHRMAGRSCLFKGGGWLGARLKRQTLYGRSIGSMTFKIFRFTTFYVMIIFSYKLCRFYCAFGMSEREQQVPGVCFRIISSSSSSSSTRYTNLQPKSDRYISSNM